MTITSGQLEGGAGTRVAVLGAGSWGTALAMQLVRAGTVPLLWDWDARHMEAMRVAGRNEQFLPDHPLPRSLILEPDLERAVRGAGEVIVVVPSHAFVGVIRQIAPWLKPGQGVSWACRGLEPGTGQFLHEPAQQLFGGSRPLAVITGPSFAIEEAADLPTAITVAGTEPAYCARIARLLHAGNFRAYTSDDMIGVEVGGAVKNVLAIAAGMSDGLGFGANTRIALITRGLVELMRLGVALGAKEETFMGLACMGDLVLTCTDNLSRNRRMGLALASGMSIEEAKKEIQQVVEGVLAAEAVKEVADDLGIEMPICQQVYQILYEGTSPREAVQALMGRELKPENL